MPANLKKSPLFEGLSDHDLHAIAAKAVIKTFAKDVLVVSEGEFTGSLYVILSGRVRIFLADESGKELILAIKGAGAYFGEMALDEGPRSASVVTLEPCRFSVISKGDFKHLLLEHPEVSLRLVKDLVHVVRTLNKSVKRLTMLDVYGRVSRLLLDLAVEHEGKLVISGKLTQQDVAAQVGASREMINRIFRGLATGGYIKIEGHKLTITKTLPERCYAPRDKGRRSEDRLAHRPPELASSARSLIRRP